MMFERKNRQNEICIQLDDVELIMGEDFAMLPRFLSTTFCKSCSGQTTIIDYQIFLDDRNDLIFDGCCAKCGESVSRYIETGWSSAKAKYASHIRAIKNLRA